MSPKQRKMFLEMIDREREELFNLLGRFPSRAELAEYTRLFHESSMAWAEAMTSGLVDEGSMSWKKGAVA